jgi:S-DNA-T family DNA segregation ATPase FtsK/SpoIIIE
MLKEKNSYILMQSLNRIVGICLFLLSLIYIASLISFNYSDPSFNSVSTNKEVLNIMGLFGSHLADLSFQLFGLSSFILSVILLNFGFKMIFNGIVPNILIKIIITPFCVLSMSLILSLIPTPQWWSFKSLGGVNGVFILDYTLSHKYSFINKITILLATLLLFIVSLSIILNIKYQDWIYSLRISWHRIRYITQNITNITIKKFFNKDKSVNHNQEQEQDYNQEDGSQEKLIKSRAISIPKKKSINNLIISGNNGYKLPLINLLVDRSLENKDKTISKASIQKQSETLLKVLEDFGVYGKMIGVQLGPVVTLHEFEPAAGTKASRVIGLADDIARSMSAISARIAVISGKTSIGIELPNPKRQMIFLKELIESKKYQISDFYLPMILGKNIGGELVISDLAKMPHLLIAGTTGSGKSVGLNVMILSLLFKLTPEECKFIMIDPKMLELSIYNGIPHLLSPVVTEPAKAVVALKWVVAEMEERYRLMSSFAVRNIAGYNEKAQKAALKGQKLTKKVQTGFDPTTGKPIIEEISFEPKKLPFIVVIVDEMADLMLVAGKEIESSIQRLAQMARAAGIHIIMATQRPSVDVITGVIKANFPTRISFQVTSRIDSRTILGIQGAEQLLGQGDMIYMSGGSKMIRAHGPFCSDKEIEDIVNFIKNQDYKVSDDEEISFDSEDILSNRGSSSGSSDGEIQEQDTYSKAVAIVRRDNRVSISYIQRQLRIGYNKAATLVEKMEEEGVVTAPSISGKREVIPIE